MYPLLTEDRVKALKFVDYLENCREKNIRSSLVAYEPDSEEYSYCFEGLLLKYLGYEVTHRSHRCGFYVAPFSYFKGGFRVASIPEGVYPRIGIPLKWLESHNELVQYMDELSWPSRFKGHVKILSFIAKDVSYLYGEDISLPSFQHINDELDNICWQDFADLLRLMISNSPSK